MEGNGDHDGRRVLAITAAVRILYILCVCVCSPRAQVFRVFRQVCEEQRRLSEGRYRSVMLEAIQDAVYLSAVNQQLQTDNTQLRRGEASIRKNRHQPFSN